MNFLMVIMASGFARGRVRTTTTTATATTESRKMATIIQIIAWQRHAALVYCVLLWDWTSMLWSIDTCQNKVSANPYHVTISRAQVYSSSRSRIFLKLTAGSCLIYLLKTGHDCPEGGYTNPGLKLKSNYWNSKQKAKQYTERLTSKLQNSNQNFVFSWVNLNGLLKTRPRSYAFQSGLNLYITVWSIFHSVTHFIQFTDFPNVTHFSHWLNFFKCDQLFSSVTHFYGETGFFKNDFHISQCDTFFQMWSNFHSVFHFFRTPDLQVTKLKSKFCLFLG